MIFLKIDRDFFRKYYEVKSEMELNHSIFTHSTLENNLNVWLKSFSDKQKKVKNYLVAVFSKSVRITRTFLNWS
jgi:hypothetical protein